MIILPMVAVLGLLAPVQQASQQPTLVIEPAHIQLEADASRTVRLLPGTLAGSADVRGVSVDTRIATVDGSGTVHALRPGTVRILAIVGERRAEAMLVVTTLPPAEIELSTDSRTVFSGMGAPLNVIVRDRQGSLLPNTSVEFATDEARIATVDVTGRLTAHQAGTTTVRAQAGSARARMDVAVIANPVVRFRLEAPAAATRPAVQGDLVTSDLNSGLRIMEFQRRITTFC